MNMVKRKKIKNIFPLLSSQYDPLIILIPSPQNNHC